MALLSNAIPALAHLEGGRWRLDRYFPLGEAGPTRRPSWTVRLDAPRGVSVAAPGVVQPDGSRRLERARDYSFAAGRLRRGGDGRRRRRDDLGAAGHADAPDRQGLRITRRRLPRLSACSAPTAGRTCRSCSRATWASRWSTRR